MAQREPARSLPAASQPAADGESIRQAVSTAGNPLRHGERDDTVRVTADAPDGTRVRFAVAGLA